MGNELTELLQKEFSAKKLQVDDTGAEFQAPAETKSEVKTDNKAEGESPKPEDKQVLSNTDSPKESEPKVEPPVKVPSFEDLLAERTEGKFKTWDELQSVLNEPKTEFANEQIQKINDYVKNGGKITDDWFYYQNADFNSMDDPFELISEAMRLEDPDITDKEIEYRIKNDYKTEEWSENEEEANEVEEVFSARLLREAEKARQKLNDFKEKSSFSTPPKSEEQLKAELLKSKEIQENWEKQVEETIKDFTKIPVKIDEKETFDVSVSDEERKSLKKMAKDMGTSMMPLLSKFIDKKGHIDVRMLQEGLYKMQNFDTAVKAAYTQGLAKGNHKTVKDIKNTNFNPDSKTDTPRMKTLGEQIAENVEKHLLAGRT